MLLHTYAIKYRLKGDLKIYVINFYKCYKYITKTPIKKTKQTITKTPINKNFNFDFFYLTRNNFFFMQISVDIYRCKNASRRNSKSMLRHLFPCF